ncbi:hypothetical protein [Hamadaea sp.]|nr:hypothetical protein [Hamadaea sp.]
MRMPTLPKSSPGFTEEWLRERNVGALGRSVLTIEQVVSTSNPAS